MNLNMSFKQMDPSDAIKFFTQEKCETLSKYSNGRISVNWIFSVEKMNQIAHCHLVGNNMDFFAEASHEDLHAAIIPVLDKIEKQIQRRKEIVKDHLHKHGHRVPASPTAGG